MAYKDLSLPFPFPSFPGSFHGPRRNQNPSKSNRNRSCSVPMVVSLQTVRIVSVTFLVLHGCSKVELSSGMIYAICNLHGRLLDAKIRRDQDLRVRSNRLNVTK